MRVFFLAALLLAVCSARLVVLEIEMPVPVQRALQRRVLARQWQQFMQLTPVKHNVGRQLPVEIVQPPIPSPKPKPPGNPAPATSSSSSSSAPTASPAPPVSPVTMLKHASTVRPRLFRRSSDGMLYYGLCLPAHSRPVQPQYLSNLWLRFKSAGTHAVMVKFLHHGKLSESAWYHAHIPSQYASSATVPLALHTLDGQNHLGFPDDVVWDEGVFSLILATKSPISTATVEVYSSAWRSIRPGHCAYTSSFDVGQFWRDFVTRITLGSLLPVVFVILLVGLILAVRRRRRRRRRQREEQQQQDTPPSAPPAADDFELMEPHAMPAGYMPVATEGPVATDVPKVPPPAYMPVQVYYPQAQAPPPNAMPMYPVFPVAPQPHAQQQQAVYPGVYPSIPVVPSNP